MSRALFVACLSALAWGIPGAAQETGWPAWRGPTADGIAAADAAPPVEWSEDDNLRWKVGLPGLGNSTPVIHDDLIFLTTAIDLGQVGDGEEPGPQPGPPDADHVHRYLVLALDRETGDEVWRTAVAECRPVIKGHVTSSHASPSPSTDGQHVVAFFGSEGLAVLDRGGDLLWFKDLGDMETLAAFGEGSTPALHDGTVVVQWDQEKTSFVAAFDVATGAPRWRQERDTDSSWGSPAVAEGDGRAQVILTGSDATRAYDLETGAPVWSCGGMSTNPVNSPLVADGVLYVMNNYQGTVVQAIRLAGAKGELLGTDAVLWTWTRHSSYVPMPLVHDGLLYYLHDSKGILSCLDARTGEPVFLNQRLGIKSVHASPVLAAGRLYFASREGACAVVRADREGEVLAVNQLDDVFDASPVVVGPVLYLRGHSSLYCIAAPD